MSATARARHAAARRDRDLLRLFPGRRDRHHRPPRGADATASDPGAQSRLPAPATTPWSRLFRGIPRASACGAAPASGGFNLVAATGDVAQVMVTPYEAHPCPEHVSPRRTSSGPAPGLGIAAGASRAGRAGMCARPCAVAATGCRRAQPLLHSRCDRSSLRALACADRRRGLDRYESIADDPDQAFEAPWSSRPRSAS